MSKMRSLFVAVIGAALGLFASGQVNNPPSASQVGALPLAGGTMTGQIQGWTGGTSFSVGTVSGAPSTFFLQKSDSRYGFEAYDNNDGSTTCCTEDFNGEVYNRTANLSGLVAPYRAHIDPSNTQTSDYQIFGFASGAHGDHSGGLTILADGQHSYSTYFQAMGTYNNFWQEGFPFGGVGVATITYVSGGTLAGTGHCLLIPTNGGGFNAQASLTVTAGVGSTVTVLTQGQAFTSTPTAAAVSNLQPGAQAGTATCSGTVVITSTAQASTATVGTRIEHTSTGKVFDIYQGANADSADIISVNANFINSGAYTGNYLDFLQNSTQVYGVTYGGIVTGGVASVATATTIAPVEPMVNLTGTTAIATITLPLGMTTTLGGCLTFFPASTVATTTAGNIQAVYSLISGKAYQGCYNGSKWYFIGSGI